MKSCEYGPWTCRTMVILIVGVVDSRKRTSLLRHEKDFLDLEQYSQHFISFLIYEGVQ
jgi:hypothetical protein